MELKELLATLRRWAWLLATGLLVGMVLGYLVSNSMDPVYKATTKLMISRSIQDENPDLAGLNSQQLVQTYVQILKTKPLLDTTIEKTGIEINSDQVSVNQIPETQIIQITIENDTPENAALIANTMVQVLIQQNEDIQSTQFVTLESRLTKQAEQVKAQIDDLQAEYDQAYGLDYQDQLNKVDEQIAEIQAELSTLQGEMGALNPVSRPADRVLMEEKQLRVNQLQTLYVTYEQIRANLLVLGRPIQSNNIDVGPHLQQLQSTLNLYQTLNLNLIEDLEKVRLARLQQTPNIVQLEDAIIPEKPVRPIPTLYTLLGGMVGAMIAIGLVFFIDILQTNQKMPEEVIPEVPEKRRRKATPSKNKVGQTVKAAKVEQQ